MRSARLCLVLALSASAALACKKKTKSDPEVAAVADPPTVAAVIDAGAAAPTGPVTLEGATALAHRVTIVDGHVDLPWRLTKTLEDEGRTIDPGEATDDGDFDHPRAAAGGLDVPFMSIYIPASFQTDGGAKAKADSLIDMVEGLIESHPDKFAAAPSPDAALTNKKAGLVSLAMGIENGAAIEDKIANVAHFHARGVRYMTLTHSKDNLICDSSYDKTRTHKGLSKFGREVVAELNRVGIMIDVSHVSDDTFRQVIELSRVPVIASHSSARHFIPGFERNMSDEMISVLGAKGGVMMINFGSTFVSKKANDHNDVRKAAVKKFAEDNKLDEKDPKVEEFEKAWKKKNRFPFAALADVADHIDHAVKLAGIDHVGFGSDFDGVGDSLPTDLKDAGDYPKLVKVLLERGYSEVDIEKLAGANALRVWRTVEAYAAAASTP